MIHPGACPRAPLDPSKVKAGDTVTIVGDAAKVEGEVHAVFMEDALVFEIGYSHFKVTGADAWTLTAHQPAPEPEPEWKPGTVADISVRGRTVRAIRGDKAIWWTGTGGFADDDEAHDVRPLVVIDPAAVDVDELGKVWIAALKAGTSLPVQTFSPLGKQALRAVLSHLGIEAP